VPPIIYAIAFYPLLARSTSSHFTGSSSQYRTRHPTDHYGQSRMERLDWSLLRAAAVLGAHPFRVATRIARHC